MTLSTRLKIYLTITTVYVLFGLIEGWYDIFPWGAVIIGVAILAAEIGTQISIRKRK